MVVLHTPIWVMLQRLVRTANDADCFAVFLNRDLPGRLASYTFSPCFYTPVVQASHGDPSGVRGAAWLWAD
jgi:hypothetical protein